MTTERRRFLADRMLGRLARWLRVAGQDVASAGVEPLPDRTLLERARAAGRIVLTRDRRFPGHPAERLILHATELDEQLLEFFVAFPADPLAGAWTRCTVCNAPVEAVARDSVLARLPPRVREHGSDFRRCTACGHLFWQGTHTARLRARLERLRTRLATRGGRGAPPGSPAPAAVATPGGPGGPDSAPAREAFDRQLRALFQAHGYSWRGYRKVRRRLRAPLAARAAALGLPGIDAYLARLASDPAERRRLDALVAIPVSRFFRDREDWRQLAREVFPSLAAAAAGAAAAGDARAVRALCLGCASGEEPYTLRILWEDWWRGRPDAARLAILACDVRADLLARARRAVYPPSSVHSMPPDLVRRHVMRDGELLRLDPAIVRSVTFAQLDIYEHALPGPAELVLCRNSVFTYLAPERRDGVAARLVAAIVPGGYLMVGGSEGGAVPRDLERRGRCLFRRPPGREPQTDLAPTSPSG